MSNFDLRDITLPDDVAREAFQNLNDFILQLPENTRHEIGQFMLNLVAGNSAPASPLNDFSREAVRWTGQSLIDGIWNSTPLNISPVTAAAAAFEYRTDALLGVAIGVAVTALFFTTPVGVMVPGAILGGYLATAANFAWLGFVAPLVGNFAKGWLIDFLKYSINVDIADFVRDLYYDVGAIIASPLLFVWRDPLSLDLDGDGIELVSLANSTTYFDLDGNGFAERTGWVSSDDGILVRDGNRNGNVDSVAELFGSATQDGFAVLETFDDNHDGKIDAADAVFADLKVWRDLNQNGVSEAGELFTLGQLGIQSIWDHRQRLAA
jgi:hypothetical protein